MESIAYADSMYKNILTELPSNIRFSRSEIPGGITYEVSGFLGKKRCTLIYTLMPYKDKEGGDAILHSASVRGFDLRFEQESSYSALNNDTEVAFAYLRAAATNSLEVVTYKIFGFSYEEVFLPPNLESKAFHSARSCFVKKFSNIVRKQHFVADISEEK